MNLNKTSQLVCTKAGGFVTGSGCSTQVYHADIFFFSVLLFVFTFFICMALKEFRHSAFFPSKVSYNHRNLKNESLFVILGSNYSQ
jgi:hypothetical protein